MSACLICVFFRTMLMVGWLCSLRSDTSVIGTTLIFDCPHLTGVSGARLDVFCGSLIHLWGGRKVFLLCGILASFLVDRSRTHVWWTLTVLRFHLLTFVWGDKMRSHLWSTHLRQMFVISDCIHVGSDTMLDDTTHANEIIRWNLLE